MHYLPSLLHVLLFPLSVFALHQICEGSTCDEAASFINDEEQPQGLEMLQKGSVKVDAVKRKKALARAEQAAQDKIRQTWRGNCSGPHTHGVGIHAPMSPEGYRAVASLCCNYQMEFYITRAALTLGYTVCDRGSMMGLIPWHSCKQAQTLDKLYEDIHSASPAYTTCPGVQNSTLECTEPAEDCVEPSVTYADMSYHRRRVIGQVRGIQLHQQSVDKEDSAHIADQKVLKEVFENSVGTSNDDERMRQAEVESEEEEEEEVHETQEVEKEDTLPVNEPGQNATLDEEGYKTVAALKNNTQMRAFVRRAAHGAKLRVLDEGALQGILPFYSGVASTQTYEALLLELENTANSGTGAWIQATP